MDEGDDILSRGILGDVCFFECSLPVNLLFVLWLSVKVMMGLPFLLGKIMDLRPITIPWR